MRAFTSRELKRACEVYSAAYEAALPDPSMYPESPSTESVRHVKRTVEGSPAAGTDALFRRITAIAAVFVILFGSWLTADAGARERVVSWTKEVFGNTVSYQFESQGESGDLPKYELGWVPRGFEKVSEYTNSDLSETIYKIYKNNKIRGIIVFVYYGQTENAPVSITDFSGREIEHGNFLGYEYDLYMPEENSSTYDAVFIDTNNEMVFAISTNLDKKTIFKLIKRMKRSKSQIAITS